VERPVKELKGFQKINLLPGQSKKVRLPLAFRSFATFDEASEGWVVNPGKYELMLGTSSKDIRQRIVVDVL
jgi:beta-glucosidase